MKTNVPTIASDTIVPTDNTEWNNDLALKESLEIISNYYVNQ